MADKSALLAGREERDLVLQGKTILEDQRDLLAQETMAAMARLEAHQEVWQDLLDQARRALRFAVLRHGGGGLAAYAATESTLPAPRWQPRNLSGALLLGEPETGSAPPPSPGSGWDVSTELDAAVAAFHELMRKGLAVAAADNDLGRLTRVFARTQRRANALDNVILPELQARIRVIEQALDDDERENVVRARLARARSGV
jgi:V/A-type H+-transporting ATPase subunit D